MGTGRIDTGSFGQVVHELEGLQGQLLSQGIELSLQVPETLKAESVTQPPALAPLCTPKYALERFLKEELTLPCQS